MKAAVLAVLVLLLAASVGFAQPDPEPRFIEGEILVKTGVGPVLGM